ncbi:exonuclease [Asanoa sp. WMMD1127]|uniref:exonuclease n=1 Tax=Asanoa sp. WMMD1127 TaxID=3016107 RepID=UPI0024170C62|nr:exonuclease [Asanoa sp. WMMD1127]MDG4824293.1 exonuclease [Asanoa sp. WMMD1127]
MSDSSWVYVVTDVELDGPWPGANSMRSFASVAVSLDGTEHGRFEAVLEPLPGTAPNEHTLAFFETVPQAWAAATENPEPVTAVLNRWTTWLQALPGRRVFAAAPLSLDGPWIDYYLRRFTRYGLHPGHAETDPLFHGAGVCITSYAAAVTGRPPVDLAILDLPPDWFGQVAHTHHAIDDALGYANLLVTLAGRAAQRTCDSA